MCYSSNAKMIQFNITFLICIILILGLSILVIFFIPEDLFHRYEDDDLNCFAFTVSDEKLNVREYDEDKTLEFVLNKIKKHYD